MASPSSERVGRSRQRDERRPRSSSTLSKGSNGSVKSRASRASSRHSVASHDSEGVADPPVRPSLGASLNQTGSRLLRSGGALITPAPAGVAAVDSSNSTSTKSTHRVRVHYETIKGLAAWPLGLNQSNVKEMANFVSDVVPAQPPGPGTMACIYALQNQIEVLNARIKENLCGRLVDICLGWRVECQSDEAFRLFLYRLKGEDIPSKRALEPMEASLLHTNNPTYRQEQANAEARDRERALQVLQGLPLSDLLLTDNIPLLAWVELRLTAEASLLAIVQSNVMVHMGDRDLVVNPIAPLHPETFVKGKSATVPLSDSAWVRVRQRFRERWSNKNATVAGGPAKQRKTNLSSDHLFQQIQLLDQDTSDQFASFPVLVDPAEFFLDLSKQVARECLLWMQDDLNLTSGASHMTIAIETTLRNFLPHDLQPNHEQLRTAIDIMNAQQERHPFLGRWFSHRPMWLARLQVLLNSQTEKRQFRETLVEEWMAAQEEEAQRRIAVETKYQTFEHDLGKTTKAHESKLGVLETSLANCLTKQAEDSKRLASSLDTLQGILRHVIQALTKRTSENASARSHFDQSRPTTVFPAVPTRVSTQTPHVQSQMEPPKAFVGPIHPSPAFGQLNSHTHLGLHPQHSPDTAVQQQAPNLGLNLPQQASRNRSQQHVGVGAEHGGSGSLFEPCLQNTRHAPLHDAAGRGNGYGHGGGGFPQNYPTTGTATPPYPPQASQHQVGGFQFSGESSWTNPSHQTMSGLGLWGGGPGSPYLQPFAQQQQQQSQQWHFQQQQQQHSLRNHPFGFQPPTHGQTSASQDQKISASPIGMSTPVIKQNSPSEPAPAQPQKSSNHQAEVKANESDSFIRTNETTTHGSPLPPNPNPYERAREEASKPRIDYAKLASDRTNAKNSS